MKRNIGTIDMLIRLGISAVLFYIGFASNPIVSGGISQKIVAVVAFLPLVTGIFRFCPLYMLIGVDTCGCRKHAEA